ncbi:MAG: DNA-binding protein [Candidatus Magnetoovum sp. WYHC-5]|nr:DNA-binding protein [Candidatus Magnetoovum sp. WYHC-5]
MVYKQSGNDYILRIDKDEDVSKVINDFCKNTNISCGTIRGIGAAKDVKIGRFETQTKEYVAIELKGDFEILELNGNITTMNGEPYVHIHAVFSDEKFHSFGGHLNRAIISTTCEVIIHAINSVVEREFSNEIGLFLFKL